MKRGCYVGKSGWSHPPSAFKCGYGRWVGAVSTILPLETLNEHIETSNQ
jgi:hypothetical protein